MTAICWEYHTVPVGASLMGKKKWAEIVQESNVLGAQGWEVVAVSVIGSGDGQVLLKRPLNAL